MKRTYIKPSAVVVHAHFHADLLTTSRYSTTTGGEPYDKVTEDGDDDKEPTPMAKFDKFDLWE